MTKADRPVPCAGIMDISPYVPGKSAVSGSGTVIKLSSNETPLGPSKKAVEAYHGAAKQLERYPDGGAFQLREAIASVHNLERRKIVCGAGSDELLKLLASAYLAPGDEAIYTQYGFLVYRIIILANGATPIIAPEKNYRVDVDEILEKVTERTKIVFLANPNNPTGSYVSTAEIRRLRGALPDHVLLVLDGAYAEYVEREDYQAGNELVEVTENTVMTRTFSKIYGLASLRIGWAYCPPSIADVLARIRDPFNVSGAAIAAGAHAVEDLSHVRQAVSHNNLWLAKMTDEISRMGLQVLPSIANFLLILFPGEEGQKAHEADAFLNQRRIILRRVDNYGLPYALRLTLGTEQENKAVLEALSDFTKGCGLK